MFHIFNDGKSFNIGCESAVYQHQSNMLVKELSKNLNKKYLRMIESVEPAHYNEGWYINLKDHLITTKDQKRMEELQEAVWDAGQDLFLKLHDLGDEEFGYDMFKPTSSSADDVEQAINHYIKTHEDLGYTWKWEQVEQKFDGYNDENDNIINQRVQDYKPVYLFTQETA